MIEITMDAVFEVESTVKGGYLYVDFLTPQQVYDKVVVIDAGHGGGAPGAIKQETMEKDINLAIVLQLKELLDKNDRNIGVYYTRTEDVNPTFDQRASMGAKAKANLYISAIMMAASTAIPLPMGKCQSIMAQKLCMMSQRMKKA